MTWVGGSDSHGGDNGCSVYIGDDDQAGQSPSGKGSRVGAILPAAMVLSTSFRKGQGMKTPDAFTFFWPKGRPSWTQRAVDRAQNEGGEIEPVVEPYP